MSIRFHAERAISPQGQRVRWVVLDEDLQLHPEATDWLTVLQGADRSPNTLRVYAGRLALFLTWCSGHAVDWRTITLASMARFRFWLESTPGGNGRPRSAATINATITAVVEFLRYCAAHGVIAQEVANRMSETRYLTTLPSGFDPGENDQRRVVRAKAIKVREVEKPYEALTADQCSTVVETCSNSRDRFMAMLMLGTGIRIGEALGLRRQDMHFLPDSRSLGCAVAGAHIHVRHRRDNLNGALAKSRFPRAVPVDHSVVAAYAEYAYARDDQPTADANDMVFVNLYSGLRGRAMSYQAAKDMFDRLSRRCGFTVRPHMLRHTAATAWVRAGVAIDVVQQLLGHASPSSTAVYLHASDEDKRAAVEKVAAQRTEAAS